MSKALIIIKKYANRRLYNTDSSTYVTLDDLAEMVKKGDEFAVQDAKSEEDITRQILAQIIFEQENKEGQSLLPANFLKQIIKYYGDQMEHIVPSYLTMSMESFAKEQEKWRETISKAFTPPAPQPINPMNMMGINPMNINPLNMLNPTIPNPFEEQIKSNMALFEKSLAIFNPTTNPFAANETKPANSEIDELKKQMAAMAEKINKL
jgi:polyhydroxyalkanoate synthesis repressor PhaR